MRLAGLIDAVRVRGEKRHQDVHEEGIGLGVGIRLAAWLIVGLGLGLGLGSGSGLGLGFGLEVSVWLPLRCANICLK